MPGRATEHTADILCNTIGRILGLFSPLECEDYFVTRDCNAD